VAEPDITGGGPQQMSFPGMPGSSSTTRTNTAARLGAKVTVDGVEKLDGKFKSLLQTLRSVRGEMQAINNGGNPVSGGVSANPSTSKLGDMIRGFGGGGMGGAGTPNGGGARFGPAAAVAGVAGTIGMMGVGVMNNRMTTVMNQSVGISSRDTLHASMYGFDYRSAEANRFKFSGRFGGSREEQMAAQTMGFSYGQTYQQNLNYMGSLGNAVQASGGTQTIMQAAANAGDFLDPITMRRAVAMGITPGRVGGQVMNPNVTAMGYLDNYQRRRGGRMNEADFTNMASAGSTLRFDLKRLYGLDDSGVDQIRTAGMQNMQFREKRGRDIDFENSADLDVLGLNESRLGLRSQALSSAVGKRDARFFAKQEGAMVKRLGQEEWINDKLGDVEDAFSGLINVVYQLENAFKGLAAAAGAGLLLKGALAGAGGGAMGGLGGAMGGMGGIPIGATPQVRAGAGMVGGPSSPIGGPGGMGMAAKLGMGAAGAGMAIGGLSMAGQGGTGNTLMGGAGMISGGAMIGFSVGGPKGAAVGAAVGAAATGATALYTMAKSKDAGSVQEGRDEGVGMNDRSLINSLTDYGRSDLIAARGGDAGPKQRGRYDVWAARRGALVAALLSEATESGVMSVNTQDAAKIGRLIEFFSSDKTSDDGQFRGKAQDVLEYTARARSSSPELYQKYFGNAKDPFSNTPIDTPEYQSLIMTGQQLVQAYIPGGGSGDPLGVNTSRGGDGNPWTLAGGAADGRGPGHPSWDKLDGRMKDRLSALLKASGGRVWVGEGWRDPGGSEGEFLRRHYEDPNGKRQYKGKRYTLRKGEAPMAPPGQSNHNIGLAADLVGDMTWLQQNAAKFGLKTFADVNNEPWHVQLAELANGFLGNGADMGTGESNDTGDKEFGEQSALGRAVSNIGTGVGFSISNALAGGFGGGGGGWHGTGASTTAGDVEPWTGGNLTAEQVAVMAHQAGFRGQDLVNVVAIAKRESSYNPNAHNGNRGTGDNSYGLMQINMLGELGPARLRQFGLGKYEDLFDPMTNLRAAYMLYQSSGNTLQPWGGYKGRENTYDTDVAAAARAVQAAGIQGDPVGHAMRPDTPAGGGGGNVTLNLGGVTIQSNGNADYDADSFIRAVTPKLEEMAGMLQKRTAG